MKHEQKSCPACGQSFECRTGDILKCQCYGITIPETVQQFVAARYWDCLCRACLTKLATPTERATDKSGIQ